MLAGPPSNPARDVPIPSPRSVLESPGSLIKFFPQVAPIAAMSPTCSMIAARATTIQVTIAPASNFGKWKGGNAITPSDANGFVHPKAKATI